MTAAFFSNDIMAGKALFNPGDKVVFDATIYDRYQVFCILECEAP